MAWLDSGLSRTALDIFGSGCLAEVGLVCSSVLPFFKRSAPETAVRDDDLEEVEDEAPAEDGEDPGLRVPHVVT